MDFWDAYPEARTTNFPSPESCWRTTGTPGAGLPIVESSTAEVKRYLVSARRRGDEEMRAERERELTMAGDG